MQNKSSPNQGVSDWFLGRWQCVASVWQCVALWIHKVAIIVILMNVRSLKILF